MVRFVSERNVTESSNCFAVISASTLVATSPTSPTFQCESTSNSSFNCSHLKLSKLPKNIPKTVVHLNLSHNNFQLFDDDAFDECCENIRVLDLSNNEISSLSQRHFERLNNLEVLYLSSNQFTTFNADTFIRLTKLRRLDLRRNPIELDGSMSKGFLVSSHLEELNLDYCNISEIPHGTFTNLSQLLNLTLAGNLFDDNIDTSAFEPLDKLIKLRINNLSKTSIYMLCEKLVGIDIITFDEYNISCTILSNDGPFEDSYISNDPVEEPKIDSVMSPPATTRKVTVAITTTVSSVKPSIPVTTESSTALPLPQVIETSDEAYTNRTKLEPDTASMNIDNETMKFILIGNLRLLKSISSEL